MNTKPVACVLLGAGTSTRMGKAKLLIKVEGRPIFEITLGNHMDSALAAVCAVIPGWSDGLKDIMAAITDGRAAYVEIERPCEMSNSLRTGWQWIREHLSVRGIMISLADKPLIGPHTIDLMIDSYLNSDLPLCVPTYRGHRGHPVIVSPELESEIMSLEGDRGARDLLEHYPAMVQEVKVETDEVIVDFDCVEDLKIISSRLSKHG